MINRFIYQIIGQSTRAEITRLLDAMQINGPPTSLDDSERDKTLQYCVTTRHIICLP